MSYKYLQIEKLLLSGDEKNIAQALTLADSQDIDIQKLLNSIEQISKKYCWLFLKDSNDIKAFVHAINTTTEITVYTSINILEFDLLLKLLPHITRLKIYDTTSGYSWPDFSKFKNIQTLYIHSIEAKSLPMWMTKFENLEKLDLNCDLLNELPLSIGKLASLNSLSLKTRKGFVFPESIQELEQLRDLDLICETIPKNLNLLNPSCELSLCMIGHYFGQTELKLDMLKNITHLNLVLGNGEIPNSIVKLSNLKQLTLENFVITKIPINIKKLATHLESLIIFDCKIEPQNITKLKAALPYTDIYLENSELRISRARLFLRRYVLSPFLILNHYFSRR